MAEKEEFQMTLSAAVIDAALIAAQSAITYQKQNLTVEQQAQARENIGAGLPPVLIDLDTYGETPVSLILGSLFQQGGGTMENAHLGKLMEDLLTDATLCVKFTFGVNALYLYGLNVCRVGGKCVQLAGSGVMIHQKTPYLMYLAIDNSSYADKNYGTVSLFAQELAF